MKIKRAVKVAAIKNQVAEALEIAHKMDIYGMEIQEIFPLIEKVSFEKRGKIILEGLGNYPIKHLAYHFPLKFPFKSLEEFEQLDLAGNQSKYIFDLTEDTIKEAAYTAQKLNLKETLINVHLFGFIELNKATIEERNKRLAIGEKRLAELNKMAKHYSSKYDCQLLIVRENNPPDHGGLETGVKIGILDYDPRDIARTANAGIYTNLDFAHLWLYMLYRENGKNEFPGADLNIKVYPEFSLEKAVEMVAPSLKLIHINDAGPDYSGDYEGLEIGKGTIPHQQLIELIAKKVKKDIIGTYEIKDGHIDLEAVVRSDKKYRELFGKKFFEYFA